MNTDTKNSNANIETSKQEDKNSNHNSSKDKAENSFDDEEIYVIDTEKGEDGNCPNSNNKSPTKKKPRPQNLTAALKDESEIEFFDPEKCPCDIGVAEKHGRATKIGIPNKINLDIKETKILNKWEDYCMCCGLTADLKQIPLLTSGDEFAFLGIGVPLYFHYCKWTARVLLLGFFIYEIYLLALYGTSNMCVSQLSDFPIPRKLNTTGRVEDPEGNTQEILCNVYGIEKIMVGNTDFSNYDLGDKILGMVYFFLMWLMFIVQLIYQNEYKMIKKYVHKTPASYSSIIDGLPKNKSIDEIREFFYENTVVGKDSGDMIIRSINVKSAIRFFGNLIFS